MGTDVQLGQIVQMLMPLRCLRSVDLSGNLLTDVGVGSLLALFRSLAGGALALCGTVMRVDVSANRISVDGVAQLADAVCRSPSVVQLAVYNQSPPGVTADGLQELSALTRAVHSSLAG